MRHSRSETDIGRTGGRQVAAPYDRLSRWYDLLTGPFEARYREAGLQALAPQEGEVILEVGFGTGHGLVALARAVGPQGRVVGVDRSWGMCRVANRRLQSAGVADRVAVLRGDGLHLPLDASAFDAAFMSFTLELFPTAGSVRLLQECLRVLRRGGRLGVVAMARPARLGLMSRLYLRLHEWFPRYVDCRPIVVPQLLVGAGYEVQAAHEFGMAGLPVAVVVGAKP